MLTLLSRLFLLLSAFAPLFFIWSIKAWPHRIAWVFLAAVAIGIVGTGLVVTVAQRDEGEPVRLSAVEDRQSDLAAYLVTYLIPFVTAPLGTVQDAIATGVFLLLLLVLYFTSDLIAVNPLLSLFGLRLYRATFNRGSVWLLGKHPSAGIDIDVAKFIGSSIYVEVGA